MAIAGQSVINKDTARRFDVSNLLRSQQLPLAVSSNFRHRTICNLITLDANKLEFSHCMQLLLRRVNQRFFFGFADDISVSWGVGYQKGTEQEECPSPPLVLIYWIQNKWGMHYIAPVDL